jgi:hypothetical protein
LGRRPGARQNRPLPRTVPLASGFKHKLTVSLHSGSPVTPVEPLRYVETAFHDIPKFLNCVVTAS